MFFFVLFFFILKPARIYEGVFLSLSPSTLFTFHHNNETRSRWCVKKQQKKHNKKQNKKTTSWTPRGTRSGACPDLSRVHWPGAGCSAARWRRLSPCKFLGTWKPSRRIWWRSDWSPLMWNPEWQQTRGWPGRCRPPSARSRRRPWRAWR